MNRRRAVQFWVALLLLVLAAACGGSSAGSPTPAQSSSPGPSATPAPSPSPAPNSELPVRDLLDLARRFQGYAGPELARTTPFDYQVGDSVQFDLVDLDTAKPYTITATVRAITAHAYFLVQNDSPYSDQPLDQVAADFEDFVWPTVTSAFGEPRTPGIDSDPRITVLNATLKGAGGYVSSIDEYPPQAVPYSAGREMVYIDASALATPGAPYNSLVSHELQHLIHRNGDPNEESWVNEGLSQVAHEMGGGDTQVSSFLDDPDTQLNFWPAISDAGVHYGESELFFDYLLDHYGGRQNAKALVDEQANGIAGVQAYLDGFGVRFDDVFADFVAADLLDLPSGPYSHDHFDGTTTAVTDAVGSSGTGTVSQFGADYLRIPPNSGDIWRFQGSTDVTVGIPNTSGALWWSGRSDGIDSKLTREVDLSSVSAATLNFDTWYDIEDGWDYAYVAVSADGGARWTALPGQHTTTTVNPIGAAYGPGYTGDSGGWVPETVDLSAYAGHKVLLRFEYVTDDATNLTGIAVDNIRIPEIGFADTSDDPANWTADGFTRVDGPIPQRFIVQLIKDDGEVQRVTVADDNTGSIVLGGAGARVAISAATPGTTEVASYSWTIGP